MDYYSGRLDTPGRYLFHPHMDGSTSAMSMPLNSPQKRVSFTDQGSSNITENRPSCGGNDEGDDDNFDKGA